MKPDQIKTALLRKGWGYAIDMLCAIERRAAKDPVYGVLFKRWLSKGGTILLRDELCWPFKCGTIVANYKARLPLPFDNMWMAIDTAWCNAHRSALRQKGETNPP